MLAMGEGRRFGRRVSGTWSVGYGLIGALLAIGLVASLGAMGASVGGAYADSRLVIASAE